MICEVVSAVVVDVFAVACCSMIVVCLWCDVTRSSSAGTVLSLVFYMTISLFVSKAWSYNHLQVSFLGIITSSP